MDKFVTRKKTGIVNKKRNYEAEEINVYTDGACVKNGKADARA